MKRRVFAKHFDKPRFFRGLILLLLAPVLALIAFCIFALVANRIPQSGALKTDVWPPVVWPWGQAAYSIAFNGQKSAAQPVQRPPEDILIASDISSSMTPYLRAMADAAHAMARELEAERPGQIRFSLVEFGDTSQVLAPWTNNPAELHNGLEKLVNEIQSGTSLTDTFGVIDGLVQQKRGGDVVIVFFTDGRWGGDTSRHREDAERLRKAGVGIYSVGTPSEVTDQFMNEITGDSGRIYNPSDVMDLASKFREFARDAVLGASRGGQILHRIDGRHFSAPLQGTNWTPDRGGALSLLLGKLPDTPATFAHPLVPLSAGLWRVGVEPPTLTFAEQDGKLQRITAESRPWLLKITWFTLLLMLLPALLWTLAHLDFSPEEPEMEFEKEPQLPDIPPPTLPTRLPALPIVDEIREDPIPTLFIGLGGMGRRALAAARGDLKQAHLGREGQPYRFLWIDLDTKEESREMPFDEWDGHPIGQLIAPADIRQADRYLPDRWETPDHFRWFPSSDYGDAERQQSIRERLNLSEGARGDRILARLALFQWLTRKDGLLPQLVERCQTLEKFPSVDGVRQIVVFGADDGGAGSGWFLDFGRLLSRIGRQQQQEAPDFIPEVIGVLCGAPNSTRPENRRALEFEIESAAMTRAFPQRVTYQPGAPLLDQIDKESPYNCVFAVTSFDAASTAAQSGSLASILVERHPRSSLLKQALALPKGQIVSIAAHSAHVLPTQVYELVRLDLFLRLLGPDILLDIVPNSQGGYAPKRVANDAAIKLLERWAQAETPGEPLHLLLAAAIDPAQTPGYIDRARKSPSSLRDWFGKAFPASLNRRLHGQGESDGMRWQREMMPSEAIASLRLLAGRLEQNVKPDLGSRGVDTGAVDQVINLSRAAADGMEKWARDFCRACEQAARRIGDLDLLRHNLSRLRGRTYLDLEPDPEQVDRWAKQCLDSWLSTPDNISAIRQRLFFEVSVEGSNSKVVVHSRIADPKVFNNAEETAEAADQLARSLAYLVPTARIGGALANLKDDRCRTIAQSLFNAQNTPRHVLVVTPKPSGTETQRAALEDFKLAIPHRANHGDLDRQTGDDHSAIRRVELAEAPVIELANRQSSLPFVETGERSADLSRRRAERKYQIVIPIFPPQLRIALANPTAFQSFARAYRSGHIVKRPDAEGREQWIFLDTGDFLTAGPDHSLASAAANYVWRLTSRPQDFTVIGNGGDFSKLDQWKTNPGMPDDDTIALISIDSNAD